MWLLLYVAKVIVHAGGFFKLLLVACFKDDFSGTNQQKNYRAVSPGYKLTIGWEGTVPVRDKGTNIIIIRDCIYEVWCAWEKCKNQLKRKWYRRKFLNKNIAGIYSIVVYVYCLLKINIFSC